MRPPTRHSSRLLALLALWLAAAMASASTLPDPVIDRGYPLRKVYEYVESVRRDSYNTEVTSPAEYRSLRGLMRAFDNIEIHWLALEENCPLVGQTLETANLRAKTGASVVAMVRGEQLIANPKSHALFEPGDRIGVIGEPEQIEQVQKIVCGAEEFTG